VSDDNGQPPEPEADTGGEPEEPTREHVEELKREAVKHRRDARAAQTTNDELRAELERLRVEHESDQEKAIREAVEAERQRLTGEFATERLHNRLRVHAAGKLRDAEDAVLHLGGTLKPDADDKQVDDAIEQLIKDRDYLAAPQANGTTEGGLVTQGARSQPPSSSRESSPDDWIRARARGR
jgi:hypothetical protein